MDKWNEKTWTWITKILPHVDFFTKDKARTKKRKTVLEKLIEFFNRFFDISSKKM